MEPVNQKVKEAVQTILNELNGGRGNGIVNAISETVQCEHRTLQQLFWSHMLKAQILYADARHDGRNEKAVEFAALVKRLAEQENVDMGFPYI